MKEARFFCNPISEGLVELAGAEAHHLADVLRLRVGDSAELFDGEGTLASAVVSKIRKRTFPTTRRVPVGKHAKCAKVKSQGQVVLQVEKIEHKSPRGQERIIIVASLAKGERFDWLISKCTELGVDRIFPVLFERTVKIPKASAVTERYKRLAVSATKQCRRLFLPQIDGPAAFGSCLEILRKDYPAAKILWGSCGSKAKPLIRLKYTGADTVAFVGPEGGLTAAEERLLAEQRAIPVRLSETVLRIETAAVAFAAILAAQRDSGRNDG